MFWTGVDDGGTPAAPGSYVLRVTVRLTDGEPGDSVTVAVA